MISRTTTLPRFELDFTAKDDLGRGTFGRVVRATHKLDNQTYAIKILRLDEDDDADNSGGRALKEKVPPTLQKTKGGGAVSGAAHCFQPPPFIKSENIAIACSSGPDRRLSQPFFFVPSGAVFFSLISRSKPLYFPINF